MTEAGEVEERDLVLLWNGAHSPQVLGQCQVFRADGETSHPTPSYQGSLFITSASGPSPLCTVVSWEKAIPGPFTGVRKPLGVLPGLSELGLDLSLLWSSGTHQGFLSSSCPTP